MPSNSPPSSQPEDPTPIDPQAFIEYSRGLHEWTLQRWMQAVRAREERRRLFLLEQGQHASRSLQSQPRELQQAQQTSARLQQRMDAPSSASAGTSSNEPQDTQSPKDRDKPS